MNIPGHHFSYQEKRLENMNNSFEENINTCRNRSISLTIKIPKEFIPRLKPKKGTTIPSPITLSSLKVNYLQNILFHLIRTILLRKYNWKWKEELDRKHNQDSKMILLF